MHFWPKLTLTHYLQTTVVTAFIKKLQHPFEFNKYRKPSLIAKIYGSHANARSGEELLQKRSRTLTSIIQV